MPARTGDITPDGSNRRRVYGRRQGRPLRGNRLEAMEELMPALAIPPAALTEDGTLHPSALFPHPYSQLWFEIGFGNGEHVAALMEQNPDHAFIAAEPFINGMSAFLKSIRGRRHDHVRVLMDDALKVVDTLADSCVDGFYILNPDPWPKVRHHKRRIVSPQNLTRFARVLKPGGKLVMTTDVDELAGWMRDQTLAHTAYKCLFDSREMPAGWIATRYEQKGARAGRQQTYMVFEKQEIT